MTPKFRWKYSLFGIKDGKNQFLDRSTRLGRLVLRCKLDKLKFDIFEIFMDESEYVVRGYVKPNGHIDWVKEL